MFGVGTNLIWTDTVWMFLKEYGVFFAAGILFSMPVGKRYNKLIVEGKMRGATVAINAFYPILMMGVFLVGVTYLVKGSYNPFIYFNF